MGGFEGIGIVHLYVADESSFIGLLPIRAEESLASACCCRTEK